MIMIKSLISHKACQLNYKSICKFQVLNVKEQHKISLTSCLSTKNTHSKSKSEPVLARTMKTFKFTDYDCIGFDLDSTILRYNVKNLVLLEYDLIANFLVDKRGYNPKYLKQPLSKKDVDFLQKGLFFDFLNGNILKLTPDGKVHKASHGTKLLNNHEIEKYYPNREWDISSIFIKDPLMTWNGPLSLRIRTLLDVFDMPAGLIFARAVDTLDEENGGPLKEYNIWPGILDAFIDMYSREHFKKDVGNFFSTLKKNPEKYIYKCDKKTLDWIRKLREKRKTFLVTGSHIDFVEFTTNYAFGKDWKSLFDIVICYAKKPGFFTDKRPFYSLKDDLEDQIISSEQLQVGGMYSHGNWSELMKFFSNITGKSNLQCLYAGDNLLQDVYAPNLVNCDAMVISAEQLAEGIHGHDLCHEHEDILISKVWGSFFTLENSNEYIDSFWNHIIKKYSKICVPQLEMISDKPLEEPMECFAQDDNDKELRGYHPSKPITTCNLK